MAKDFDETQAYSEGWGLFQCEDEGVYIQRLDDLTVGGHSPETPDFFASDAAAEEFVLQKAFNGSLYHQAALKHVSQLPRFEKALAA